MEQSKKLSRNEVELMAKTIKDGLISIMANETQCTEKDFQTYEKGFAIIRDLQLKIPMAENLEDSNLDSELVCFYYDGCLDHDGDGCLFWHKY